MAQFSSASFTTPQVEPVEIFKEQKTFSPAKLKRLRYRLIPLSAFIARAPE